MTITLQKCNCCLSWIVPYLAMLWSHIPNYMANTNINPCYCLHLSRQGLAFLGGLCAHYGTGRMKALKGNTFYESNMLGMER